MFTLALIFAGTSISYAQCTPGPLSPAPGVEYDYGVTLAGATTAPTYLWYATEATNLITGAHIAIGTYFNLGPTAGSAYDNTTGGAATINLVWLPAAIGKTIYLVVHATAQGVANGQPCTVENTKVYEIKPVNTFLLAVIGSDLAGDPNSEVCAANITSALVNTTGPSVTYLYGQNTLYYKITASGILGGWRPSIRLPALAGQGQNYVSADWAPIGTSTWNSFGLAAGDIDGGDFTSATNATVTDATAGSAIIVRIVIDNVSYETLADQAITMGVDGYLPTAYSDSDIKGGGDCTPEAEFGKTGTSTIKLRPSVTTTGPAFITQTP